MTPAGEQRRAGGYSLVAVAACSWGTWPLVLRHAAMPAALQSAVVMGILTLTALPFMLKDRVAARASRREWLGVAWLGVSDALNVVLFFAAYQWTSVAIAVLTHYLTPVLVAISAPIVLRERAPPWTYAAVAVALFGLVLLLQPWRADLSSRDLVGAALGAGSAVFYTSNVLVNKRLAPAFSASELMFFHGLVATPMLFAMTWGTDYAAVEPSALLALVGGAVGPGALAGLMFVWGLRRVPASHATVLTLLEPLVAVLLAGAFLGQRLGAVEICGGLLILAGAAAVVTGRARPDGLDSAR